MSSNSATGGFNFDELFRNPDFFLWQFDGSQAVFARMTRGTYYDSIFCDRRIVAAQPELATIDLEHLMQAHTTLGLEPPELCYIFHIAHCGSTLLARALDTKDQNLVCREPMALRQMAFEAVTGGYENTPPERWSAQLRLAVSLLGRCYNKSGPVVVKANVPVNFVIPQLMRVSPGTRAVLLYSTFENYLLAVLKSSDHQQWVQLLFEQLASALSRIIGIGSSILSRLSPAEMAACLWAVQMTIFTAVAREFSHTKTLDSEALFENPTDAVTHCFGFFGQPVKDDRISQIITSDLFRSYAKSHERKHYDIAKRIEDRVVLKRRLKTELVQARAWLDANIGSLGIPTRLPNPLSGEGPLLLKESDNSESTG